MKGIMVNKWIWHVGILLIPVSLFFSMRMNGVIIAIAALMGVISIFKKQLVLNKKHKLFLFLSSLFILSFCFGSFIDVLYDEFRWSRLERLIPFLIFPFLALCVLKEKVSTEVLLKCYSYVVTGIAIFVFTASSVGLIQQINGDPVLSDMWKKSGSKAYLETEIRAPDGEKGVVKLIEDESNESHNLIKEDFSSNLTNVDYHRSIFVKSAGKDWILIRQYDGKTHNGAWFNIKEGFIGTIQEGVFAEIEDHGNGWYRCTLFNKTSAEAYQERLQLSIVNNNSEYIHPGDGMSGVYVWGGIAGTGNQIPDELPNNLTFDYSQFFGRDLIKPLDVHPTYFGLYIILASLILLISILHKFEILPVGAFIFNTIFITLLASKGVILSFFIALVIIAVLTARNQSKKSGIVILGMLAIVLMTWYIPKTHERFEQSLTTVTNNKDDKLSTSGRLKVWKTIAELNPYRLLIGYGNEGGERVLREESNTQLNAHNQYLQAVLGGGILSLVLLLVYIFSPLWCFSKYTNEMKLLVVAFVAVIFINCFFESLLNRQWGIVFISFFYSLFYVQGELQD